MEDAIRELGEASRRLRESVEALTHDIQPRSASASTININAGGIGVWVAATSCIVMLAMLGMGGMWLSREFTSKQLADNAQDREITDLGDHLHAIYMQAPQLQPPTKKEVENVDSRPHPEKAAADRFIPGSQ